MPKKIKSTLLFLAIMLTLCACHPDGAKSIQSATGIPEGGAFEAETLEQITVTADADRNAHETQVPDNTQPETDAAPVLPEENSAEPEPADPVPAGKPMPVEPERPMPVEPENTATGKEENFTCTFSIECSSIFDNLDNLDPDKTDVLPADGIILSRCTVTFHEGESVYDVLQRICRENKIQMEASFTPMYNSAYVEGIHNLYEFDCGSGSGWMYRVNGWYPNYGCSRYQLAQGDVVEWRYTCDLGRDIGGGNAMGD